jgi:acyl-homoserine lactone acylase PvdQ
MFTARADRIEQLIQQQIAEKKKFTKADMKRILADTTDVYCLEVVKMMRKRVETDEGKYRKVFGEFLNFDCAFRMESTISTIYLSFLKHLYAVVHPNQPDRK